MKRGRWGVITPAMERSLRILFGWLALAGAGAGAGAGAVGGPAVAAAAEPGMAEVERQFRSLPMAARELTGPLFWLHGDESRERLEAHVGRVAAAGNGCFTAESRPHDDWLGEGWFRDLGICLEAAKRHGLKMWIFDEKWWPSQGVDGRVPPEHGAKRLVAEAVEVDGGTDYQADGHGGERYIATVAGRLDAGGRIEGDSLVDLRGHVTGGRLGWRAPAGKWQVIRFGHVQAPPLGQSYGGPKLSVDGASREAVEWFIRTVYQPHHDRFGGDFGTTIPGFFYDEPETRGDWGTELDATLAARGVDWKKAYVAHTLGLAGEDDVALRYQYLDALAETWGRVMYGGMAEWCHRHGVKSIGHFMEHDHLYLNRDFCAGDMMLLQKHSDMGALDLVCQQMYPGQRPHGIYQTPKLASSVTHAYAKAEQLTMCEIFGAYGQHVTYPEMKWLTDQMQVRGVNFMIPHSFNPRAPRDLDCPPFFHNGGFEPRYPLYRVYADYTTRLSLLLAGGSHVCPVALLFGGNAGQVGKMVPPEDMTSAIQDALYDCDWLPFEVLEGETARVDGGVVALHDERYRVVVVPPVEVIPHATLDKVRRFFEQGGIVIGHGFLPTKSATPGKTAADIGALVRAVWGEAPQPGTGACRTSAAGGRSYLLGEKPSVAELVRVLRDDAGVPQLLEVVEGETGDWLHLLHRRKAGRDVILVCNQNHEGDARRFRFRSRCAGTPEAWDAMRNEIAALPVTRAGGAVEFELVLEPMESVLLVFREGARALPARLDGSTRPLREPVPVVRDATPPELVIPNRPPPEPGAGPSLDGGVWVWFPEGNPAASAPAGTRCFRGALTVPPGRKVRGAQFIGTCDNSLVLHVNGREAGRSGTGVDDWQNLVRIDFTGLVVPGRNVIAIAGTNMLDGPAGLIGRCEVSFEEGEPLVGRIDAGWKAHPGPAPRWTEADFDDAAWPAAVELAAYGQGPWGRRADDPKAGPLTASPVVSDPFVGHVELPAAADLAAERVCLEADAIAPEAAARITVNGAYAGGFIGRPFRLDVTAHLRRGTNRIVVEPFAPHGLRLVGYPR